MLFEIDIDPGREKFPEKEYYIQKQHIYLIFDFTHKT